MKILLVEDPARTPRDWQGLLESLGHEVVAPNGVADAWERFQRGEFPLVLVDLSVRLAAAMSLVRQIRSVTLGERTVVLIAAGRDQTDLIASVIAEGADDYVRTPVDAAVLGVRLSLAARQAEQRNERVRFEGELRRRLDPMRAVYNLADASSHARPIEELYAEAIEGAERALHTRRAAILLFDAKGVLRFQAWQGISERYRQAVEGHSPWTRADFHAAPIVVEDVERDERVAAVRDAIREEGIRSLLFVPIVYRGELLGKLTVYYGAPHVVTDEDLLLVQAIASHVASAEGRTRAEHELRASEERFRQLAENIDAVFSIVDLDRSRLLYLSPSYARLTGREHPARERGPLRALEAVHPEDRPGVLRMQSQAAQGEVGELEYRVVRADGAVRWVRGRSFPVRDEQGRVYRVAGITEDVTRLKQLEEQLVQSERLSAAAILVGGIAHQLNNPLTGVLGFSQLLLRNPGVEGKVRASIERIHEEALRAKQIVGRLLAFARHRRPRLELVDLNAIVRGTLDGAADELRRAGVVVDLALARDLPATAADRLQLRQAFTSLVTHATRSTNGDGAPRPSHMRVTTALNERGRIEIRFADDGPGVSAELRRSIFDPPMHDGAEHDSQSLGLSMAFAIVQDHHGELFVTESEPSPGATFVVELPVRTETGPIRSPAV